MFKKILLTVLALVAIFVVYVALQPADFRVTRTAKISAAPAAVFAQVNDFHRWDAWSPWAKIDPAMKQTYEGTAAGTGAVYTWAGDSKVGKGRMEVTDSHPGELVRINLDFLEPFHASNVTDFAFKPEGDQTVVTWSMSGKNNFVAKAMCVFMNMDKMVGGDFEKGLAQLKAVSEGAPKP